LYRPNLVRNSPDRHRRGWILELRHTGWKRSGMMPPVEHSHLVPLRRKETNHAGAYEAGPTDDKNAHSNLAQSTGYQPPNLIRCS